MQRSNAVRSDDADESAQLLFARIGGFLFDQHLDPNPTNFAFAYHVIAEPGGALAQRVDRLTDGGVRLTMRDIDAVGAQIDGSRATVTSVDNDVLVARAHLQIAGFAAMVGAIRDETRDFGRDLAASADAIARGRNDAMPATAMLDHLATVTADMLHRIAESEARLARANDEATELREKLEEARADALRDPLTGLANRRAFERAFDALGIESGYAIAICDVDHFKAVNDRFGHSIGDRVLRAIADALRTTCEGHLVARYGGEEFAILLTCPIDEARTIVEEARRAIAKKRYRLRETDEAVGEVTISAGISAASPGDTPAAVFHRADRLMYRAKASGRNCVIID